MLFKESNKRRLRLAARLFTAWILAWVALSAGAARTLTMAHDFSADATIMASGQRPMLVLFSRDGCPWCERVRREYLVGIDVETPSRVVVREVRIDSDAPLTNFDGTATTHHAFAAGHGAKLAPTLMLLGPKGEALTDALVGYQTSDFYGATIERTIDDARKRMRNHD